MLTVKTSLSPSEFDGIGLFAAEDIPKGKIIWEYFPLIDITYTEDEWSDLENSLSKASFKKIKHYAIKENSLYIVCVDNAQFMNTNEEYCNVAHTEDLKSIYAIKDIKKGEEILCHYLERTEEGVVHRTRPKLKKEYLPPVKL